MMLKLSPYLFFSLLLCFISNFLISICPANIMVSSCFAAQNMYNLKKMDTAHKENFYKKKKHGWYWYEKEAKQLKKTKDEKKPDEIKNFTYSELWNLHPDAFQNLVEVTKKKAVQSPTEKNMEDYLVLQDIARRKAVAFASVFTYVTQKQQLTTNDVYPITKPGQKALLSNMINEKNNVIRKSKKEFGLIMFYSNNCSYCSAQVSILAYFKDNFKWPVRMINIDEKPDAAARFNVSTVPQIILVYKKTKDYLPVSTGVISLEELKTKLYRSIRLMRGEISPQQWFIYEFEKNKSTDPLKYINR